MSQFIESPTGSVPEATRPSANLWRNIALAVVVAASLGTLAFVVANADSPVAEKAAVSSAPVLTPQQIAELRAQGMAEAHAAQWASTPEGIAQLRAAELPALFDANWSFTPEQIAQMRAQAMVDYYEGQPSDSGDRATAFAKKDAIVEGFVADEPLSVGGLDRTEALVKKESIEGPSDSASRLEYGLYPRPVFADEAEGTKSPLQELR